MAKALVIKMQSYKEYKSGLLTKKECVEGRTLFRDDTLADIRHNRALDRALDELFGEVQEHNQRIGKVRDWSKAPHHKHCCCDKCAPTREDLHRKVKDFNKEVERRYQLDTESLAPSDCEPE
ncbi:MAG: hypothetical protein PVI03_05900 [Candidatus Thorarchaeota archaeon]|jgi:hypothetical protein